MVGTQRLSDDTGIINRAQDMCSVEFVRLDCLPDPGSVLSAGELEKYNSFKFEKRKREWLGGRTAAKKLIAGGGCPVSDRPAGARRYAEGDGGGCPAFGLVPGARRYAEGDGGDPRDIVISYDKYGRPSSLVHRCAALSISHCQDYAVAAAGTEKCDCLGIDLEKIQNRSRGWIEESFHDCEASGGRAAKPEEMTALWTQKEAVLKALGLGLTCSLRDVKIGEGRAGVVPQFTGKALGRWRELGSPHLTIVTETMPGEYILSIAYGGKNG